MGGIEAERCEYRQHFAFEERRGLLALGFVEPVPTDQVDPVRGQPRSQLLLVEGGLLRQHRLDQLADLPELLAALLGGEALVLGQWPDDPDPFLKELIEIRREDRQELESLQ